MLPPVRRGCRVTAHRRCDAIVVAWALVVACLVATANPSRAQASAVQSSRVIGTSVQGRQIIAYRLGNPMSPTKALLVGSMHGDERAGVAVARALISRQQAVTNIDLWVVPTMNPDGYAANTRGNAHKVDLNRNWPDNWAHLTGMYYSGTAPLSEPETRAMYAFLKAINPRYAVVLHQPLNGVDTTDGGARDPAFRHRLSSYLGLPEKAFNCWSVCLGSMTGWFTHNLSGAAVTVEFPAAVSPSYVTSAAPVDIVKAMGGGFASLSSRNPVASLAAVRLHGSSVTLTGWAVDLDAPSTAAVVTIFDGSRKVAAARTQVVRDDVNQQLHITGTHGFWISFAATNGAHSYCVVVTNIGSGSADTRLCAPVVAVDGSPAGHVDATNSPAPGTVHVVGWALDPDSPATTDQFVVSVDGVQRGAFAANVPRPDVNSVKGVPGDHGFEVALTGVPEGDHRVCVTALNIGWSGAPNRWLGCQSLPVAAPG